MGKDWTGNQQTQFACMGASNFSTHDRAERDLYTTNQVDFIRFLSALGRDGVEIKNPVYECAAGLGHLVEILLCLNYDVVSTDIEDRSGWENFKKNIGKVHVRDFLKLQKGEIGFKTIITNPPFKTAVDFVEKGMELLDDGQQMMLLLRIQWLESARRYELFKKYPYKYVYVYVKRANCYPNGDETKESGACCFCWVIYEKGFSGEPILRFIE